MSEMGEDGKPMLASKDKTVDGTSSTGQDEATENQGEASSNMAAFSEEEIKNIEKAAEKMNDRDD
jgi:hypothetical protein